MTPPAEQMTCLGYDSTNQTMFEDSMAFHNPPPAIGGETTEERITNLEKAFMSFSQESSERIARIERDLGELVSLMRQQQRPLIAGHLSQNMYGPNETNANSPNAERRNLKTKPSEGSADNSSQKGANHDKDPSSSENGSSAPQLSPVVCPNSPSTTAAKPTVNKLLLVNVEKKWYTKRPFPEFEVRLVSGDTNRLIQHTLNHQVRLRLLSGTGTYVDHLLNAPLFVFSLVNGRCTVAGIRFSAVSSRNGGFFQFELSLSAPQDSNVAPVRSQEIRVLSERLKNEPKADNISELHSGDSLVRVPGIGKKYAARFRELGLMSISDLAAVNDNDDNGKRRRELLEAVRKDRGALTEAKLNDLIKDAQSVVDRDQRTPMSSRRGHHDGDEDEDDYHTSDTDSEPSPSQKPQVAATVPQQTQLPASGLKHSLQGEVTSPEPLLKRIKLEPIAPFSVASGPLMTPKSLLSKLTPQTQSSPQSPTQTQTQTQAQTQTENPPPSQAPTLIQPPAVPQIPVQTTQAPAVQVAPAVPVVPVTPIIATTSNCHSLQEDTDLENVKSRINNNNTSMINDSCDQSGEVVTCVPVTITPYGSQDMEFSDFNVDSMLNLASSSSMFAMQDVDSWL